MGILERAKVVAAQKKAEFDKGVEKEKRYKAYKHPDAAYIAGAAPKTDYEEAGEFAERKEKEDAEAAARRARKQAAIRSAAAKAGSAVRAGGQNIARKFQKAMKEPRRPARQRNDNDMLFGSGFGKGFDPVGLGSGKRIDPLGMGGGKRRQAKFSLF
jgi:hypothetical protein